MPSSLSARLALVGLLACAIADAQVMLTGRVVDENEAPVADARVSAQAEGQSPLEAYSGPSGIFRIPLPGPGHYLLSVTHTGYFQLLGQPVDVGESGTELTLVLNPQHEVFQSVTVGELPSPVDPADTSREQHLSGTEINNIPYPSSHSLRNAMKVVPGVVQDPSGGLHFHGGAEYQTEYTLNGFDISDPIDGRYSTRLAVEGMRSLNLVSSRESPQYGRGSAGTLNIQTENGTDEYHVTGTNFIPGIDSRSGVRLGHWTPRAGVSGPLKKGRAWFSDSFNGEYNSGFVPDLPKGQNTNNLWSAGNLFHTQVNLTAGNILYADLLSNFDHQSHFGLGALDPVSTTSALLASEWFTSVKDTQSWADGSLLEFGFGWQRVYHRRVPEGDNPYVMAPSGRSGNYFVDSIEHARRQQVFVNYFPKSFHFGGVHQLQFGADGEYLSYTAHNMRTGYEIIGLSGLPLFTTTFQGSGNIANSSTNQAAYVNDHWQPWERVTLDVGFREDWDDLVGRASVSPRASVAFAPFHDARTKLTGGYSVVHDATNLSFFSRPLDQQSITVPYSSDGTPGAPLVTTFLAGNHLRLPRYTKWSAGVERDFGHRMHAKLEWLRKRGRDGFVYAPPGEPGPVRHQRLVLGYGFGGNYELTNRRRDAYDEVSLSIRQSFGEQYGWMASYVRSRDVSNAVLDVNVDQPLQVLDNFGRAPWDSPNRFLGWGYFPLFTKNWAAAFLLDWRSGFPFAVTDDAGTVVGPVDSHRFPDEFALNFSIERRLTFGGFRFAVRGGCNNITDHANPTAVNAVIGSPDYLHFYGLEGRHFVIRIRIFGRARH